MTAQPKQDTLSRLLELLKALPHHRWATPRELRDQLADRGFDVDVRSVQRDLKTLQESFPLDHNDKGKPHGWRWSEQAAGGIASMSTPEALMLVLVQQHLQAALPSSMLEGFEALFARARQRLDRLGPQSGAASWPDKVKAVPPGLPMLTPQVDPGVQKYLAIALLENRQIAATYSPGPKGAPRAYRLHPIGLILRGNTAYLVASKGGATPAQLFAVHRFQAVEVLPDITTLARDVSLEAALKKGRGQFGIAAAGATSLKLVLACDPAFGELLQESPLSEDQTLRVRGDGRVEVHASVDDSWELRWWLLGRGPQVEVLGPAPLRREIGALLKAAAARYEMNQA